MLPQSEAVLVNGNARRPASPAGRLQRHDRRPGGRLYLHTASTTTTGSNWQARIGSFCPPAGGQRLPDGVVYNSVTNDRSWGAGHRRIRTNPDRQTDASGYHHDPAGRHHDLTAGPLLPGYPAGLRPRCDPHHRVDHPPRIFRTRSRSWWADPPRWTITCPAAATTASRAG
jgi:hypothetical protein